MKDILTSEERSKQMSLVRAKDTKPEMQVRKLLYSLGYRYRIHASAEWGAIIHPAEFFPTVFSGASEPRIPTVPPSSL